MGDECDRVRSTCTKASRKSIRVVVELLDRGEHTISQLRRCLPGPIVDDIRHHRRGNASAFGNITLRNSSIPFHRDSVSCAGHRGSRQSANYAFADANMEGLTFPFVASRLKSNRLDTTMERSSLAVTVLHSV